jgi:hypothetical protein
MQNIESFLEINKWRLIDFFKDIDKNKDWVIIKTDLMRQYEMGRLNANELQIEELCSALGSGKSNSIDYKALASGRSSHLLERRKELKGYIN